MNDNRYNGWTNFETWNVNLWMDNEQGIHDYWLEVASEIYANEAEHPTLVGFTKKDDAIYILADRLKEYHEEQMYSMLENAGLTSSVWADLLGSALHEVKWQEIAENLLENIYDADPVCIDKEE